MSALKTSTSDLGDSRVRVEVEVEAGSVEQEVNSTADVLGRDMKVPGFRAGKVPAQVVLQQVGRDSVLDEAVRRALPAWYEEAIADAGIVTVGSPDVDLSGLPVKGDALSFTFEVAVRPPAQLGDYKGVEAARREAEVSEEEVDSELGRLRESLASLEAVERAANDKDFVVIDFEGKLEGEPFEGGDARGFLLELGSGRLIPGFEEQLVGASAGDEREVRVEFPDEYQAEHLAGREVTFDVSVKEVKEKRLPEADDDLAVEAGGYDTLDELKDEIRTALASVQEEEIEGDFREAAVDAAAANAKVDVPHDLVHAKAHEMWHATARRLSQQGLEPTQYLQMVGKTEEELLTESEPDAERAIRREAVLAAIVEAEGIEVSDDELLDALRAASAPQDGKEPSEKALRRALKKARAHGADEGLREDIAMRKAVDLIVDLAKPVEAERAAAREAMWTPERKADAAPKKLWTPGS